MTDSTRRIVVYGAGGHGKVVADIVMGAGSHELVGFLDDGRPAGTEVLGHKVLGGSDWLTTENARGVLVALGIGDNGARERVYTRCRQLGAEIATLVHPTAAVARSAHLGAGSVVMANASINPDARIGIGVIVNTGAVVEHDCDVGDFAHVSPNAALGGAARLGRASHLGLGAVILPGIRVGDGSLVGAGAAIHRDIEDGVVAAGVPARVLRRRT